MRSIELDPKAIEDLLWLIQNDRKLALRALKLIQEAAKSPFEGTGKPEPLKHELAGAWSRRINDEHRLVYTADAGRLRVLACRYHYDR
jgi:toxin YoeB